MHFQTLYAFVVISLERRQIVHVGVTAHPTGAWVAQRMVEAVGDAPPRYLLRDRDSIYDASFRARLRGLGVQCLLSPPRAPLTNGHTVGFLGDGINDAPALREADIGISVDTTVDIAKESATSSCSRRA